MLGLVTVDAVPNEHTGDLSRMLSSSLLHALGAQGRIHGVSPAPISNRGLALSK